MKSKRIFIALIALALSATCLYTASAQEYYSKTTVAINNGKVFEYHNSSLGKTDISGDAKSSLDKNGENTKRILENTLSSICIIPKIGQNTEIADEIEAKISLFRQSLFDYIILELGGKPGNIPKERPDITTNPEKPEEPETTVPQELEEAQPSNDYSNFELEVLKFTNDYRVQNGLPSLTLNNGLSEAAKAHTEDMAVNGFLEHDSSDGTPFGERLKKLVTYEYGTAGENIAYGYTSAQSVVAAWMDSEGHRENILNKNFTQIGISCVAADDGTLYWVQDFTD